MYGNIIWAIGVIVRQHPNGNWWASVKFQDYGHCDKGSVRGKISTKYADNLGFSIDTIKNDAERLGIAFIPVEDGRPLLMYKSDGERCLSEDEVKLLHKEAERIGFSVYLPDNAKEGVGNG